jgi:hypothetical protein
MSSDAVIGGRWTGTGEADPTNVVGDCGRDGCVPRTLKGAGEEGRLVTTGD